MEGGFEKNKTLDDLGASYIMVCLTEDIFIAEEEKTIAKYSAIIERYASQFHSFECDIRLRRQWEQRGGSQWSNTRIPFNRYYNLYVVIEVIRKDELVKISNEGYTEFLFSKRIVSGIFPKTKSFFNLFKKNIELEMSVTSGKELEEEEEELIDDLEWFLRLLKYEPKFPPEFWDYL